MKRDGLAGTVRRWAEGVGSKGMLSSVKLTWFQREFALMLFGHHDCILSWQVTVWVLRRWPASAIHGGVRVTISPGSCCWLWLMCRPDVMSER